MSPSAEARMPHSLWGHMYQGGDTALQAACGRFDSVWLHHLSQLHFANGTRPLRAVYRGEEPEGVTTQRHRARRGASPPTRFRITPSHLRETGDREGVRLFRRSVPPRPTARERRAWAERHARSGILLPPARPCGVSRHRPVMQPVRKTEHP